MTEDIITIETFAHLVHLAALEMDEEEAEYLRGELNNQLKAIREMEAIPLDRDKQVTVHGVSYTKETSAAPRQDEPKPYHDPGGIIKQAPQSDGEYVIVPDIPHIDLD